MMGRRLIIIISCPHRWEDKSYAFIQNDAHMQVLLLREEIYKLFWRCELWIAAHLLSMELTESLYHVKHLKKEAL